MVYAYKATAGVWCTLSFFIVVGSIVSFFMPFWLVKTNEQPITIDKDNNFADIQRALTIDNHAACGIMSYCIPYNNLPHVNESVVLNFEKEAHLVRCPLYTDFSAIPTVFGKVSSVLFGAGTVILLVSWIFSAISLCYGYMCDVSTYLLISIVQLFCSGTRMSSSVEERDTVETHWSHSLWVIVNSGGPSFSVLHPPDLSSWPSSSAVCLSSSRSRRIAKMGAKQSDKIYLSSRRGANLHKTSTKRKTMSSYCRVDLFCGGLFQYHDSSVIGRKYESENSHWASVSACS
eukprot:sb/3467667/